MSKESRPIVYDAPASLKKWPSFESRRIATGEVIAARSVFDGTLAACVKEFIAKPIRQRSLYEIFTDRQAGLRDTVLSADYILEIAEREDFPRE